MWNWEAFLFSCAGALGVQILHWLSVARKGRWPQHSRNIIQWILTVGLILISGVVGAAVFYERKFDALLALQTGVSAPLLISQIGRTGIPEGEREGHWLGDEEETRDETLGKQIADYFRY